MRTRSGHRWRHSPLWLKAILVAATYLAAAELGNALSVQQEFSTFWPPAGVLFVLLVFADIREWPVLVVAAVAANISSDMAHDRALVLSAGFATAKCSEAALGAFLVRRFMRDAIALDSRRKVIGFTTLAAVIAPALGATLGMTSLALAANVAPTWRSWVTWWSGDALGVIAVGAFGLAIAEAERRRWRTLPHTALRVARLAALLAIAGSVGWWLVSSFGPLAGWKAVIFLPVLLVASGFGQIGAASAGMTITLCMTAGLVVRWSKVAIAGGDLALEVIGLQAFLAVLVFAALYVTASLEEARCAEESAHVAAEKFRTLLETLPIGVSISDESGAIIETSAQAARILGVPEAEHRQREITGTEWKIMRPDGSEKPPDEWASVRALTERTRTRAQEGVVRPDGTVVWLDVTAEPIPLRGYGVAVTYQDVTEEVLARERLLVSEERLRAAHDHLEQEVADRTAELRSTNEELFEASKAKSRFLANMSHELRTPLNSIIGFSDLMSKEMAGPLTDEQRKQLGMINASGKHLLGLVNDVLDLERIETGHAVVSPAWFDVCELAEEVRSALEPQALAKRITLRTEIPESPLPVCSDRGKVKQIAMNLASNAVKFTDEGRVTLACAARDGGVMFTVSDTGIGIAADDLALVMDDFHQVDRSDGLKPSGTGLGLSISKRLVEMLGGRLEAESEFGKGSTFRAWLPNLPEETSA
jgi:PAS domain S-box-containing protein